MKKSTKFSDQELIKLLKSSDENFENEAFKFIYKTYFPSIKRMVIQAGGTSFEASDIFQDSLYVFYNHLKNEQFKEASSIRTYIYSIAKRKWIDYLRKEGRYQLTESFKDEEGFDLNLIDSLGLSAGKVIRKLLAKLDKPCQKILLLYYYENKSMSEISHFFELGSNQAAKTKKHRCLKKLMSLFEKYDITRDKISLSNE